VHSSPFDRARAWFGRDAPTTKILIVANLATLILSYASRGLLSSAAQAVAFRTDGVWQQPWTLVTYPLFAGGDLLGTLISALMLWWFGASLERAWGPRIFAPFFFALSAVFGLSIWLGSALLGIPGQRPASYCPRAASWSPGLS
jgi:membrane associated rhomboid family serine protease